MKRSELIFKLHRIERSMHRHPVHCGKKFHGRGRLLSLLSENEGITSHELAELLDVRPSSLSEMMSKLTEEELIVRTADENDKRVSHISLSNKGKSLLSEIETEREENAERITACFSDEELEQFGALCDKLCAHLEELDKGCDHGDFPPPPPFDPFGMPPPPHHGHHHGPHCCRPKPRKL